MSKQLYGDLKEQNEIFKETLIETMNMNGKLLSEDKVIELAERRMRENRDIIDKYYNEKMEQKNSRIKCFRIVRQNITPAIIGGAILLSSMYIVPMFKDDFGKKYDYYYKRVPIQSVQTIDNISGKWKDKEAQMDVEYKDFILIEEPLNDENNVVIEYTYYFSDSADDNSRKEEVIDALENKEEYDYTRIKKDAEDYETKIDKNIKETKITLAKYTESKKLVYSSEKQDGYHMPIKKLSTHIGNICLGIGIGKVISCTFKNAKEYGDYREERLEHKNKRNAARKKMKKLMK